MGRLDIRLAIVQIVGNAVLDVLLAAGLASSKNEARQLLNSHAITLVDAKRCSSKADLDAQITAPCLIRRGKNKFAIAR